MYIYHPLNQESTRCVFDFCLYSLEVIYGYHFSFFFYPHVFIHTLRILRQILNISVLKLIVRIHVFHLFFFHFCYALLEDFWDGEVGAFFTAGADVVNFIHFVHIILRNRLQMPIIFRVSFWFSLELTFCFLRSNGIHQCPWYHYRLVLLMISNLFSLLLEKSRSAAHHSTLRLVSHDHRLSFK